MKRFDKDKSKSKLIHCFCLPILPAQPHTVMDSGLISRRLRFSAVNSLCVCRYALWNKSSCWRVVLWCEITSCSTWCYFLFPRVVSEDDKGLSLLVAGIGLILLTKNKSSAENEHVRTLFCLLCALIEKSAAPCCCCRPQCKASATGTSLAKANCLSVCSQLSLHF